LLAIKRGVKTKNSPVENEKKKKRSTSLPVYKKGQLFDFVRRRYGEFTLCKSNQRRKL